MGKTKNLKRGASMLDTPDSAVQSKQQSTGARPLSERAMLVRFSVGRWYGTGADNELLAEIRATKEANGEIGTFTKRLMDKRHLSKINKVTNEARSYFKGKTLPYDDGNLRLLSVEHFFDVKKKMTSYERSFSQAVEEFLSLYDEAVMGEKKRLGKLWKQSDYPTHEQLRDRFRFELHFRPLEDAEDLRVNLPKEELEEIRKEITEGVQRNIQQALGGLVERLKSMLGEASRRMGSGSGERVSTAMIEDLRALCRDLPGFNVTNDPALRKAAEELNAQFSQVSTNEEIVKDESKRKSTKEAVDRALGALDLLTKGAKK
jgi:hypothetical protein